MEAVAPLPPKLSAHEVQQITEDVEDNFLALLEKGLFADRDAQANDVIQSLTAALEALASGDAIAGNRHMLEADLIIHQVVYDRPSWWRFRLRYQPLIVLYNLAILAYLFVAGGWTLDPSTAPSWLLLPEEIWKVPVAVLAFGTAGAVLRVFYHLQSKVSAGELRPRNQLGYLLAPWIGALFGALVFAIVRAGLWTLQGEDTELSSPWAVMALAALAGFSWEWITEWLKNVMSQIAKRGGASPKPPASAPSGGGNTAVDAVTGSRLSSPRHDPKPEPPSLKELPDQPEGD